MFLGRKIDKIETDSKLYCKFLLSFVQVSFRTSGALIKCPFDQMSFRSNVVSVKCRSINCRVTATVGEAQLTGCLKELVRGPLERTTICKVSYQDIVYEANVSAATPY